MKGGGILKLLLLVGGIGIAAYVVYRMYEQKKGMDAANATLPGTTDVTVNDPFPKNPKAQKVNVPGRYV